MSFKCVLYFNNHDSLFFRLFYGAKIKENYCNFSQNASGGRIIPQSNFIHLEYVPEGKYHCKNGISLASKDDFPFNIPFHPEESPEIINPDGPLEPEDPEEYPGDEPDDY